VIADHAPAPETAPDGEARPSFLTRGHDRAVDAVRRMIRGGPPHALLIGGAAGIGKTTLAFDLAAGLLCDDPDSARRPCRSCRGCRLVDRGIHPDVHRLAPTGPGDQIRIGTRENPEDGTVRRLATELALMPVEGGARVAIIERADRLGDDAQTALLKTLEEPPAGVTIILCADEEDRLMPTVRSRCARIRLGPVAVRDIETILADADLADPPVAARLARLSGGRPGLARSLARAPDAVAARDEIARTLLDLLGSGAAARLAAARDLATRARELDGALADAVARDGQDATSATGGATGIGRSRRTRGASGVGASRTPAPSAPAPAPGTDSDDPEGDDDATSQAAARAAAPAAERRRAAAILVGLWRDVTRDLLVVRLGAEREIRDPALLDDLRAASARLEAGGSVGQRTGTYGPDDAVVALGRFLTRLDAAGELLEANVRAEIVLDSLLLAWPHGTDAEGTAR